MKAQVEKSVKTALLPEAIALREVVANCDQITAMIRQVHGVQVMLDYDLAKLYGVQTGQLNRQVKRNIERFPADFMVRLTK